MTLESVSQESRRDATTAAHTPGPWRALPLNEYSIVTDECFDGNHADCSGELGEDYGDAVCGCDCHTRRLEVR